MLEKKRILRLKLEPSGNDIHTIHGFGYRYVGLPKQREENNKNPI